MHLRQTVVIRNRLHLCVRDSSGKPAGMAVLQGSHGEDLQRIARAAGNAQTLLHKKTAGKSPRCNWYC